MTSRLGALDRVSLDLLDLLGSCLVGVLGGKGRLSLYALYALL